MQLYEHQQKLIDLNPERHLISWTCGTGKTRTAIELANKNCSKVLIVCPKGLKENWRRELSQWGNSIKFIILGKEEFRRDWDKIEKCDGIIIDEAHFFGNVKSLLSKSLIKYNKKHNVKYRWLLTGTPYTSSVWSIYALAWHLGHEWNWYKFKNQYFYDVRMGARIIPVQRERIEEEVSQMIQKIGSTVKMEDCFDVPEQVFETEYFKMTKEQEKEIKKVSETESVHITRWTKISQILGGHLKGDGYTEDKKIDCDKVERVVELAEENPKMIVVCRYRGEIELIKDTLADKGHYVVVISGDVEDKQSVLDDLKDREQYALIVSSGCSEGWELPECPLMIFYSYGYSLLQYVQIIGRIQRANNLKKNIYLSLIISGTIDEDIFKMVTIKKMDFHLNLYENKKY